MTHIMFTSIKDFMRSTMSEDRLTGLALMHIHSDIDINLDEIINVFLIILFDNTLYSVVGVIIQKLVLFHKIGVTR